MKKGINILLIMSILLVSFFYQVEDANAKTFGQLKKELTTAKEKYNNSKNEKQLTNEQINNARNEINKASNEVIKIGDEIVVLNQKIEELNDEIIAKSEEIDKLINFIQISNGESPYLEYAFSAADFSDFIYRISVAEQLTTYNDELVDNMKKTVEESNQKKKELAEREKYLEEKQVKLSSEIKKLNGRLGEIMEIQIGLDEQIKILEDQVKTYKELGCKDNEDIDECASRGLANGTQFFRPITKGKVTSEFGMRFHPTKNYWKLHEGTDMSYSGDAVPIYAAAPGVVISIFDAKTKYNNKGGKTCGGNKVYIQHKVKGVTYTAVYMHLRVMMVKTGDVVSANTQIATMGGTPSKEKWDNCTTGQHLHFGISRGLYKNYDDFVARYFNSRDVVNYPKKGVSWTNRTTRY